MTTFLDQPDDDSGSPQNPSQNQPGSTDAQTPGNNNPSLATKQLPGRRLQNPLSNFASYTYNISLYMLTPDAYDAFILSGRRNLNVLNGFTEAQEGSIARGGGAFLIAQSGGINNTVSQRAPGFELDYYIDDLEIENIPPNQGLQSTAGATNFSFKIIEPYGFSLVSNLIRAGKFIEQYISAPVNPTKQLYVLGIKFTGYDDNGKILTGSEDFGGTLDPTSSGNGVFEKYFDIAITEFKFKVDGKSTIYNVQAKALFDLGIGTLRGFTKQSVKISGPTVDLVLNGDRGLATTLNTKQQEYLKNGDIEHAATYKVEFDGPEAEAIANASLLVKTQQNPFSFNLSPNDVKTTEDSNELASFVASPNVFNAEFSFVKETSIVKLIEMIVARSSYLTDAMKILNANQPEPENGSLQTIVQNNRVDVAWFSTASILSNPRWDKKQKIWVYDITYRIRRYETPIVLTPYVNPGVVYYGPHKVYDYWLTGNNNEVISYEQEFNNLYFQNVIAGAPEGLQVNQGIETDDTPYPVGGSAGGAKLGSVNGGQSQDFQNTFITTLYDPTSVVNAKIQILGDPDFINQGEIASTNVLFNKFYDADGYTISYGGGQVFIEINFYEGQDYDDSSGLFKINDKISFYQQRNVNNIVSGLSYQVKRVVNRFSQGRFTQTLMLVLNNFTFANLSGQNNGRTPQTEAPASGQTQDGGTSGSNGLKQDKPLDQGPVVEGVNNSPTAPGEGTIPIRNGGVVEDGDYYYTTSPVRDEDYYRDELPFGGGFDP
jgi:hypothetical protein